MDDGEEVRKDEDRAFILRLPPHRAREVRQMLADNNFQDLRLHVDPVPRHGQQNRYVIACGMPEFYSRAFGSCCTNGCVRF